MRYDEISLGRTAALPQPLANVLLWLMSHDLGFAKQISMLSRNMSTIFETLKVGIQVKFPAVSIRGVIGNRGIPRAGIGTEFDLVSPGVITIVSCWDLSEIRGGLIQTSEGRSEPSVKRCAHASPSRRQTSPG